MKLKIILLTALLSYGSVSSAFTLYNCNSVDKDLNQTLQVSETTSRAPSEDVTVIIQNASNPLPVEGYFKMYPLGTKTNGSVTVSSFSSSNAELKIITKSSPVITPKFPDPIEGMNGVYCGRAPCKNTIGEPTFPKPKYPKHSRLPVYPTIPILFSTIAVFINDGITTTYQCK